MNMKSKNKLHFLNGIEREREREMRNSERAKNDSSE